MRDNTAFMHKAPRCHAITKAGVRCPNPAKRETNRCHKHPVGIEDFLDEFERNWELLAVQEENQHG